MGNPRYKTLGVKGKTRSSKARFTTLVTVTITDEMANGIREEMEQSTLTASEIIRRAIDEYLTKQENGNV